MTNWKFQATAHTAGQHPSLYATAPSLTTTHAEDLPACGCRRVCEGIDSGGCVRGGSGGQNRCRNCTKSACAQLAAETSQLQNTLCLARQLPTQQLYRTHCGFAHVLLTILALDRGCMHTQLLVRALRLSPLPCERLRHDITHETAQSCTELRQLSKMSMKGSCGRGAGVHEQTHTDTATVSYTHLTLPTICSV